MEARKSRWMKWKIAPCTKWYFHVKRSHLSNLWTPVSAGFLLPGTLLTRKRLWLAHCTSYCNHLICWFQIMLTESCKQVFIPVLLLEVILQLPLLIFFSFSLLSYGNAVLLLFHFDHPNIFPYSIELVVKYSLLKGLPASNEPRT